MKRKILSLFIVGMMLSTMLSASVTSVFAADPDMMIITGRVTDEKGDPVALQFVDLYLYNDQGELRTQRNVKTDFEGRYSFEFSTTFNKSYRLKTSNPGVEGLYSERWGTCSPGEYTQDFTIIRYGTTVIHVLDEDGNSVPPGIPLWIPVTIHNIYLCKIHEAAIFPFRSENVWSFSYFRTSSRRIMPEASDRVHFQCG